MWELYAAVVLCAAESADGPSTHFHSCVRQAASTHTSKENVLFRELADLLVQNSARSRGGFGKAKREGDGGTGVTLRLTRGSGR